MRTYRLPNIPKTYDVQVKGSICSLAPTEEYPNFPLLLDASSTTSLNHLIKQRNTKTNFPASK